MNAKTAHIIEIIASLIPPVFALCLFSGFVVHYKNDTGVAGAIAITGALTVSAIIGQTYDMIRDSRYNYYRKTGQARKADKFHR